MKRILLSLLAFTFFTASYVFAQNSFKIMTFNLRYDNSDDGIHSWSNRKDLVIKTITAKSPEVLCIQEGLINQVNVLEKSFPGYGRVGVGRDNGKTAGEFSAIFFLKKRFKQIESATFWLSQTPDVIGSKGWDAVCNRVVTWVKLKDNNTGKFFYVFNTHFDHIGQVARRESAKLLLQRVAAIAENNPFVITGDFNGNEQSVPYQLLMASDSPKLSNTRYVSKFGSKGPDCSIFGFEGKLKPGEVIDHIFINFKSESLRHQIIDDNESGFYPSDHQPVMAEIILNN